MYGMSEEEQLDYERNTILNLERIENELIEHGMTYTLGNDCIECDGSILKSMSIYDLKQWLGY